MSRGIPAVVAELTARQLGLVDGEAVLIGRTLEEFAHWIASLYGDPALCQRVRDGALRYVAERCDLDVDRAGEGEHRVAAGRVMPRVGSRRLEAADDDAAAGNQLESGS
jgi:hypothetical protein